MNFTLSEDPNDQSYPFRQLLQGVDHYIQEPMPDEVSGQLRQYIGVVLHNDKGDAEGFVQLGIRSSRLENLLATVQIDNVLDGIQVGQNGFAFAVNKSDNTFAYYPDKELVGKDTTTRGMGRLAAQGWLQRLPDHRGQDVLRQLLRDGRLLHLRRPARQRAHDRARAAHAGHRAVRPWSARSSSSCSSRWSAAAR